eukprot:TRINITY_DN69452_c0_g1_i1.p1 TRINITY_DN69452_c0_g1~~TRINITY_DN69452_c0_g1_i1.p1  ORF type:complete len:390 (+),score=75.77 TRINITY_DN69452_c0_g1_i1:83-1252(+)
MASVRPLSMAGRFSACRSFRRLQPIFAGFSSTSQDAFSAKLAQTISGMQDVFKKNPSAAKASFHSESRLEGGLASLAKMRHHSLQMDEPEALGGTNAGPNPVDVMCAALGGCQEITYKAYAAAMGIPLESVSAKVHGNIDLRGFFAVADYATARPGLKSVTVDVELVSAASDEQLQQLQAAVDAHCPVLDMLANPVPVSTTLRKADAFGAADSEFQAKLAETIAGMQQVFKENAAAAQAPFSSRSCLKDGLSTTATFPNNPDVGKHSITMDEPEELGGNDTGPNPVEVLLAALGGCQEITYKAYASAMSIPLDSVSSKIQGDIDLRGFFAVADYQTARPGVHTVTVQVEASSAASDEDLKNLQAVVDAHCPVLDILSKPVPVTTSIRKM